MHFVFLYVAEQPYQKVKEMNADIGRQTTRTLNRTLP